MKTIGIYFTIEEDKLPSSLLQLKPLSNSITLIKNQADLQSIPLPSPISKPQDFSEPI